MAGREPSDHAKEAQLEAVKLGLNGKGAREEVDGHAGGLLVKTLKPLEADLVVESKRSNLGLGEDETRKATKEDWFTVACLNSEGSSRVG